MKSINDALGLRCNVIIEVCDASTPELEAAAMRGAGRVLRIISGHNLVPVTGRNMVRDMLIAQFRGVAAPNGITHFAFGSGNDPVTEDDIALGTETLRDEITQIARSDGGFVAKYFLSSTQLNGTFLREAGLFNASGGPTLFARYVLSAEIEKTASVSVTFNWAITITGL